MTHLTRQVVLASFLALFVWMSFCEADEVRAAMEDPLDIQPEVFWSNIRMSQGLVDFFEKRSNPRTGLSLSFFGDERPIALNGTQIYDIGLRLLADSAFSKRIIETFTRNSSSRATRDSPQTVKTGSGGIPGNGPSRPARMPGSAKGPSIITGRPMIPRGYSWPRRGRNSSLGSRIRMEASGSGPRIPRIISGGMSNPPRIMKVR